MSASVRPQTRQPSYENPLMAQSCPGWQPRNRTRFAAWQPWTKPVAGLLIIGGALAVIWYGRQLSLAQQIALGCFLLGGATWFLRLRGVSLLGPFFVCDLVRSARRGHHVSARSAYAGLVLVALLCTYDVWFGDSVHPLRN